MTAAVGSLIRLAPHHDVTQYARVFATYGRIHIPRLLYEEDAQRLYDTLVNRTPWNVTVIHGDKYVYDITPQQWAEIPEEQKVAFDKEVIDCARRQYEGRYRTLRLSDHGEVFSGNIPELIALTEFLNSQSFLSFVRRITGEPSIALADAQATRYDAGDFLHPHFDVAQGKNRVLAYVLNLTPHWEVQWGGLLGYINADGHLDEAYTPKWNALNLFRVTQYHYVSCVAPFAGARRYSITGWIRRRA